MLPLTLCAGRSLHRSNFLAPHKQPLAVGSNLCSKGTDVTCAPSLRLPSFGGTKSVRHSLVRAPKAEWPRDQRPGSARERAESRAGARARASFSSEQNQFTSTPDRIPVPFSRLLRRSAASASALLNCIIQLDSIVRNLALLCERPARAPPRGAGNFYYVNKLSPFSRPCWRRCLGPARAKQQRQAN